MLDRVHWLYVGCLMALCLGACGGEENSGVGPAPESSSVTVGISSSALSSQPAMPVIGPGTLDEPELLSSSYQPLSSADVQVTSSSDNEADDPSNPSYQLPTSDSSVVDPSTVVLGSFVDARDNHTYKTVKIGRLTWMAENLNFYVEDNTGERIVCYSQQTKNCETYGELYSWDAAIGREYDECGYGSSCDIGTVTIQGVCPEGWHIPYVEEFQILIDDVGGVEVADKVLRSKDGWYEDRNGLDSYSFNALPAGLYQGATYRFYHFGEKACFWSKEQEDETYAKALCFEQYGTAVHLGVMAKDDAYSIRCVKDS